MSENIAKAATVETSFSSDGVPSMTLPGLLLKHVSANPSRVALRHHELGRWKQTTWAEFGAKVRSVASGLNKLGVGVGTRIALVGSNHPNMVAVDLAALSLGAITIPIDAGLSPTTLTTLLRKTAAEFAFVGDQQQFDKIGTDSSALAGLKTVIIADTRGMHDLEITSWTGETVAKLALSQLVHGGLSTTFDLASAVAERRPEDPATIDIYALYGSPIETAIRTHSELAAAAKVHHPNVALQANDELLAVLSMARPRERALTEVGWLQMGAILNLGIGGPVEALELCQVQPTVVQLDAQRLNGMRTEILQRLGSKGFRAKVSVKTLSKTGSGISRPAIRDARVFRLLGIVAIGLCMISNRIFQSLYGMARIGLCVVVLLVAAAVAMSSGVAIRPFIRKAYGLSRARQLVAFDVLPESVVGLFSGLHLAPGTGNVRTTPLAGTELGSLSDAVASTITSSPSTVSPSTSSPSTSMPSTSMPSSSK